MPDLDSAAESKAETAAHQIAESGATRAAVTIGHPRPTAPAGACHVGRIGIA